VAEVFTTMLGVDIEPGEVTVEHAASAEWGAGPMDVSSLILSPGPEDFGSRVLNTAENIL
jgi:hypothetical protein